MAPKKPKGIRAVPIDHSLLDWAEYWYPISWKGVLAGGIITAVGACATIAFLLLQWRTTSIREEQSELRTATLEMQGAQANAALGVAQADIAKAAAETAKANERTAALSLETEQLREKNLEVEKAFSPRSVSFTGEDSRRLEGLGPVRWVMKVIRRDEPEDTANQIVFLLGQAKWEHFDGEIESPGWMDGVSITVSSDDVGPAADALAAVLNACDVETHVRPGGRKRLASMGPNGILIEVGRKKTLSMTRSLKAINEEFEKRRNEALERVYQQHPELRRPDPAK